MHRNRGWTVSGAQSRRRVGAGHRGAPPGGPAGGLGEVLAERELGEGRDLGLARPPFRPDSSSGSSGWSAKVSSPEREPFVRGSVRSSRRPPPGPRGSRTPSRASSSGGACAPAARRGGAWPVRLPSGRASTRGPGRRAPSCRESPTAARSTRRLTWPSSRSRVTVFLNVVSGSPMTRSPTTVRIVMSPSSLVFEFHGAGGLCQKRPDEAPEGGDAFGSQIFAMTALDRRTLVRALRRLSAARARRHGPTRPVRPPAVQTAGIRLIPVRRKVQGLDEEGSASGRSRS